MGFAKKQMHQEEEYIEWAKSILLSHEAISECEVHGYYEDNLAGDEVFDEAVAEGINSPVDNLTADRIREIFKAAIDDVGMECPGCASNADSD
ncbi:hypothetical protein [Tardiphaga sp. P5_C7]